MKKIFFLTILLLSFDFVFADDGLTYKEIPCKEVTETLNGVNTLKWEELDPNGVRSSYGVDENKWEKFGVSTEGLSDNAICIYQWRITKINPISKPEVDMQYLLYNRNGEWIYFMKRLVTRSLINQEKLRISTNTGTSTNEVNSSRQSGDNQDFLKSIEEAKKTIEEKKNLSIATDQSQAKATDLLIVQKVDKKLSSKNEKRAKILRTKILLLKKQIEQLERQIEALN